MIRSLKHVYELRQDVGYALRVLRRSPLFTIIAIATLALGIGASTMAFTIVDGVLLRPLRFADPHRLAMIQWSSGARLSPRYLHDWRLESKTLHDIAGWHDVRMNLTGRGEPVEVLADRVTANFFAVLEVSPVIGRAFVEDTDLRRAPPPEVVLSHGFWQRRFGSDPGIIGQALTLDGESFVVVGVMPEALKIRTTELAQSRAELWVPFRLAPDAPNGQGGFLNVIARLAPDMTFDQAQSELSTIARQIEEAYPSHARNWRVHVVPLLEATVRDVRPTLLVLFGAVTILLLIACANVANLLLSRGATRHGEVTIRIAIGATTGRIVRQFLTESVILAAAGGVLAVVLAYVGSALLVAVIPLGLEFPRTGEVRVDARILTFGVLVSILTAVLCGLLPSIHTTRRAPQASFGNASRSVSASPKRNRLNNAIMIAEVALALVLVAGAGLLGRSFLQLTRVEPGFQPDGVLTLRTTLPESRYQNDDRIRAFGAQLLERVAHVPGVRAAGFAHYLPMTSYGLAGSFEIEGRPAVRRDERPTSWYTVVGGRYFETMGIPLIRGRLPGPADSERTEPVFVIDQELARRYWPNQDPVGTRIRWPAAGDVTGEIIGVVGSVRIVVTGNPPAMTYFWFPRNPVRELSIVTRISGDPLQIAKVIAAEVREIDPNQPIAEIRPMQDYVSAELARPRFTMILLTGFAAAALLLAAIGLYGVIAFGVAQRTREIGVRVALGAERREIICLVMRRGLLLIGGGLVLGLAAALALGRLVSGLLYGVTPSDPPTLLTGTVFLGIVGAFAAYLPARRATRVDPVVALRAD